MNNFFSSIMFLGMILIVGCDLRMAEVRSLEDFVVLTIDSPTNNEVTFKNITTSEAFTIIISNKCLSANEIKPGDTYTLEIIRWETESGDSGTDFNDINDVFCPDGNKQ